MTAPPHLRAFGDRDLPEPGRDAAWWEWVAARRAWIAARGPYSLGVDSLAGSMMFEWEVRRGETGGTKSLAPEPHALAAETELR